MGSHRPVMRLVLLCIAAGVLLGLLTDWLLYRQQERTLRRQLTAAVELHAVWAAALVREAAGTAGDPSLATFPFDRFRTTLQLPQILGIGTDLRIGMSAAGGEHLLNLTEEAPSAMLPPPSAQAQAIRLAQGGTAGIVEVQTRGEGLRLIAYAGVPDTDLAVLLELAPDGRMGPYIVSGLAGTAVVLLLGIFAALLVGRSTRPLRRQLAESEDLNRVVIQTAVDAIVSADGKGRMLSVNAAAEEMFGYRASELLGQPVSMLLPPRSEEPHGRDPKRVLERGGRQIIPGRRRDGSVCQLELSISRVGEGPQRIYTAILRDVGNQLRAQEELRAQERLLHTFIDALPIPMLMKDREGRYRVVNKALVARFGVPREEIIGRTASEVLGHRLAEAHTMEADDRLVLEEGRVVDLPAVTATDSTGRKTWQHVVKVPVRDADGAVVGLVGLAEDISERMQAEEALRASQRMIRTMLDAIPHMMLLKDHEGRYLMVNRAWQKSYGITEAQVLGVHTLDIPGRSQEDLLSAAEADREVLEGRMEHRLAEFMRTTADGRRIVVQDIRTPLRDEKGQVIGLVDVAMDVTERKQTEVALRQTLEHVALVQQVAVAANGAGTPEEALRLTLRAVCHAEGWLLAHAYLRVPGNTGQLESTGLWEADPSIEYEALRRASQEHPVETGIGLPGEVMRQLRPVWMEDLRADPRFLRAGPLAQTGLTTGLAVPVLAGSAVVGVLEFFGTARSASASLIDLMAQVGTQLGRVVERQEAARELRESEERFRNLIEGSIQGVVILVDLRPQFANRAMAAIFGYDSVPAFLEQWVFDRAFPPEQVERLRANHIARLRGEPVPAAYETEAVRRDGGRIWVETIARRILWDGTPAIQITSHEITERKEAEAALRANERRFRRIIEQSMYGIAIHARGKPLFVNNALARLHGYDSPEEIQALAGLSALLDPEDVPLVRAEEARLTNAAEGAGSQLKVNALRRDGSRIQIELFCQTIEWQGQRCIQVTSIDVSDRERLEMQLRQAQKMEAVGQLAGGVAHDFNNILQIIRGYAELARSRVTAAPETGYLDKVLQASEGAAQVIRQLLALSRREVLRPRTVDLNVLVTDLMQMARRLIGEHIELVVEPRANPTMVMADRAMLEQVLLNLCVNARDAMPEGGTLTIGTATHQSDDDAARQRGRPAGTCIVVTVADTGSGIAPDVREHIFEPFFTTKAAGKGTGLGLSTAYSIVQQHRGVLEVESEPGRGTVFQIFLPAAQSQTPQPPTAMQADVPGGTELVLVAEDDQGVLDLIVQLLENRGYQVLTARDGEEAQKVFAAHADEIGLAILDVVMPRQSGRAVYDAIQARRPDLPVLFNTGHTAEVMDDAFIRAHRFHLLRKPYTPRQLLVAVREALDSPWPPESGVQARPEANRR